MPTFLTKRQVLAGPFSGRIAYVPGNRQKRKSRIWYGLCFIKGIERAGRTRLIYGRTKTMSNRQNHNNQIVDLQVFRAEKKEQELHNQGRRPLRISSSRGAVKGMSGAPSCQSSSALRRCWVFLPRPKRLISRRRAAGEQRDSGAGRQAAGAACAGRPASFQCC